MSAVSHVSATGTTGGGRVLVALALFAVYVVWGSTYYAMRVALDLLPAFLMGGLRFTLAGSVLFAILRARGVAPPSTRNWVTAVLVGTLLLACGNGFVGLAERTVDTGVAATVVATMPLWAMAVAAFWGDRPSPREVLGLLVGFAGVVVLNRGGKLDFASVDGVVIVLAPVAWALGSVWSRRLPLAAGAMGTATTMIGGGAVMAAVAVARGERPVPGAEHVGASLLAFAYLVVFGSLVAFSAYGYLLRTTRPAVATSYAYVNPVVALGLGALLGERFTPAKVVACALTIAGVVIVAVVRRPARA